MESGMAECFTPIAEKYGKECLHLQALRSLEVGLFAYDHERAQPAKAGVPCVARNVGVTRYGIL